MSRRGLLGGLEVRRLRGSKKETEVRKRKEKEKEGHGKGRQRQDKEGKGKERKKKEGKGSAIGCSYYASGIYDALGVLLGSLHVLLGCYWDASGSVGAS